MDKTYKYNYYIHHGPSVCDIYMTTLVSVGYSRYLKRP